MRIGSARRRRKPAHGDLIKVTEERPPRSTLRTVRTLLWVLVAVAVAGTAALVLLRRQDASDAPVQQQALQASFGGPFTLVGADGQPFSSQALAGKPHAMFFGFTRCGDVCPTTLARLVKLRDEAADASAMHILFVTIDPKNDGPKEVGQYATLFNSPVIGLTGTQAQIDQVKKQYGIFAQPSAHGTGGKEMEHTGSVLLFGSDGRFAGTISPSETNASALAKIKQLIA
jgi:protein SCO1/2